MKITKQFLIENGACESGKEAFGKVYGGEAELSAIVKLASEKEKYLDFALWLIVRCLSHVDRVRYAVFAAEKVIAIFEEKHPDDKRPREAIESAKRWIENPTNDAAYDAYAAYAAACAANAAANAANAAYAAYAAANAAYAAYDAAYDAYAAAYAAYAAANTAYDAAYDANVKKECLAFGLSLVSEADQAAEKKIAR